jgi:hypothetical protein
VEGIANRISALEAGRDDDPAGDTPGGTKGRSNSISGGGSAGPDWTFRLSATAADIDTSGSGLDMASAGLDGSASGRERSSSFSGSIGSGSGGRFSFFRSKSKSNSKNPLCRVLAHHAVTHDSNEVVSLCHVLCFLDLYSFRC